MFIAENGGWPGARAAEDRVGVARTAGASPYGGMATYTVTAQSDPTRFSVEIVGDDGVRQTMLGFATQEAAEAWVEEDKRTHASDRGFRMRWRF